MAKMTQWSKMINKERRDDRTQNRESKEGEQEPDDAPTDLAFGSGTAAATFEPVADVAPTVDDTADDSAMQFKAKWGQATNSVDQHNASVTKARGDEPGSDDTPGTLGNEGITDDASADLAFGTGVGGPVTPFEEIEIPSDTTTAVEAPSEFESDGPQPESLEPTDGGFGLIPDTVLVDDTADHSDPTDLLID